MNIFSELNCPICSCIFDRNKKIPKILTECGHNICLECINNPLLIKCPIDSKDLLNNGDYPTNEILISLIENLDSKNLLNNKEPNDEKELYEENLIKKVEILSNYILIVKKNYEFFNNSSNNMYKNIKNEIDKNLSIFRIKNKSIYLKIRSILNKEMSININEINQKINYNKLLEILDKLPNEIFIMYNQWTNKMGKYLDKINTSIYLQLKQEDINIFNDEGDVIISICENIMNKINDYSEYINILNNILDQILDISTSYEKNNKMLPSSNTKNKKIKKKPLLIDNANTNKNIKNSKSSKILKTDSPYKHIKNNKIIQSNNLIDKTKLKNNNKIKIETQKNDSSNSNCVNTSSNSLKTLNSNETKKAGAISQLLFCQDNMKSIFSLKPNDILISYNSNNSNNLNDDKKLSRDTAVFIKNSLKKNETINCSGYPIGDEGCKLLLKTCINNNYNKNNINIINNKPINYKEIRLSKCNISDEGLTYINAMLDVINNNITYINLSKNSFTDESYNIICSIIKNKTTLSTLKLNGNFFSEEYRDKITDYAKQINPNLKLEIDP